MRVSLYVPSYYKDFQCIASACRHSCCTGWQVTVDEDAACRYRAVGGEMGKRLSAAMRQKDGVTVFRLDENARCPFLNKEGLCDIILSLGEGFLSEICAEHPRYRNYLSSRTELGLGISCAEAARLILTSKEKTTLECAEAGRKKPHGFEKRLLSKRDMLLSIAQDRTLAPYARREKIRDLVGCPRDVGNKEIWLPLYRALERLDTAFDASLDLWERGALRECQSVGEAEEQLLVYFLLRHVVKAKNRRDLRVRAAFCTVATEHILALAAACGGTMDELIDIARLYSSEIEYSEENTQEILAFCKQQLT